jgi:hypothetical protein
MSNLPSAHSSCQFQTPRRHLGQSGSGDTSGPVSCDVGIMIWGRKSE